MASSRIRGVLFDVGGVLIRTPFEMLDLAPELDVLWRGPFDPDGDDLFRLVVDGRLTERAYWTKRAEELAPQLGTDSRDATIRRLFEHHERDVLRHEVIEFARELNASGLAVGLLTNDLAKFHGNEWRIDLPTLAEFSPLVDLSHRGVLKPSGQAYAIAAEEMGMPAGELLLIDDQPSNVAGAEAAGMRAIPFDVVAPEASIAAVRTALAA